MRRLYPHLQKVAKITLFWLQKVDSVEHFISELEEYIDFWNNRRVRVILNGLSPIQYRTQLQSVA